MDENIAQFESVADLSVITKQLRLLQEYDDLHNLCGIVIQVNIRTLENVT